MAAFGASTVTATEKSVKKAPVRGTNGVYTRTVSFVIPASATVGAGVLSGLSLPPGTLVLGGVVKPSQSLGSTTLAFSTSAGTFSAATAYTAETGLAAAASAAAQIANLTSATTDAAVTCTTASATAPGTDTTVTLSLVLAQVGASTADYTTYTV